MLRAFLLSCVILLSGFTIAAVQPAIAADCLRINEPLDRLACYDQQSGRTAQKKNLPSPGSWTVTESKSKIDDSPSVTLSVVSSEPVRCRYKQAKAHLFLGFSENNTDILVVFGDCFMSDNSGGGEVDIRFDNDKAFSQNWTESNDNTALGLWSYRQGSIKLIKSMFGKSKMLVRATPLSESSIIAQFPIAGIKEAIKPLQKACNWGPAALKNKVDLKEHDKELVDSIREMKNNPLCKTPDENLKGHKALIQSLDYEANKCGLN